MHFKCLIPLFLLLSINLQAIDYKSVTSGNWNNSSTWSPSGVPTSSDNVTIEGGNTITVNISNASCASLTIGSTTRSVATLSFSSSGQLSVTGNINIGGTGNSQRTGTIDMSSGGTLVCSRWVINNFAGFTPGSGTVNFTGTANVPSDITEFNNLVITSGTVSLISQLQISGNLNLTSGTFATDGWLTMGNGSSIKRSGGTMTGRIQGTNAYDLIYEGATKTTGPERTGSGIRHISINASGSTITLDTAFTVSNLSISAGNLNTSNRSLTLNGNLVVNGILSGSGAISMTGNGANISGTGSITNTGIFTLQSGNKNILSGANLSFAGRISIVGSISIFNNGSVTSTATDGITGTVNGSTWVNNSGSVLSINGPLLVTGTLSAAANANNINYTNTAASQNIHATTYHHITINKSSQTATLAGNITVNGNLLITSGTLDVSSGNHTISAKGNFTNSGTFTSRSGNFIFNGSNAQIITGATTFHNLQLNNNSGLTINSNVTINNILTLSNGRITTGGNKIIIGSAGNISGAGADKYIYGNLQKRLNTGSSVSSTFEVGGASAYLPVTLTFATITTAGDITANVTAGEHPQVSSSCIISAANINYYWTLTNSGVAPAGYSATFNFSAADYDVAAMPSKFRLSRYSSSWTNIAAGTSASTSYTANNINGFGDFVIGENTPSIYLHPSDTTVCNGENLTFTIAASGTNLTYQWQEKKSTTWSNISNTVSYSGATSSTLSISKVKMGMAAYQYRCIATSATCSNSDTSNAATLFIAKSFTIFQHPQNSQICNGGSTSFTVDASGAISGYYWQRYSGGVWSTLSNGGFFSGVNTETLNLTSVTNSYNGNEFRCIITTNCGLNDTTIPAVLWVMTPPSITSGPVNTTICEGNATSFFVNTTGDSLNFQWELSTNGGTTWAAISGTSIYEGVNTSQLTLTAVPLSFTGYRYRCIISGLCSSPITSSPAILTVNQKPYVTLHPVNSTILYSNTRNTSFTAGGAGTGPITYQWQVHNGTSWSNVTSSTIYSGETTSTLSISNATLSIDSYKYRCLISGVCSPADTTNEASLFISFHFTVSSNTNWSNLSPVPTTSSTIEIKGGATLTVDVSNAHCATIQAGRRAGPNGGNGILAFASGAQLKVLGEGSNVILGDHTRTGSIDMSNGGILICHSFLVDAIGTFTPGSGTIEFTGVHTIPTTFTSFNNLKINSTVTLGANTTVNGNLSVLSTSTLNTGAFTITTPGNLTLDGTISGTGNITLSGTNKTIGGTGNISNTGTLNLSGGNKSILAGSNLSFAGTVALASGITVTNNGAVTSTATNGITGAASTSTWVNADSSALTLSGPLLSTGTLTATAAGNTVTYNSLSNSQTVKATTYHNLNIDNTNQTANLQSAATVNGTLSLIHGTLAAGNNLTMAAGSLIERSSGHITGTIQSSVSNTYNVNYTENSKTTGAELSGAGFQDFTVNLALGETLYLDRLLKPLRKFWIKVGSVDVTTANHSIIILGDFENDGFLIPREGHVYFSGATLQTVSGSGESGFRRVTINNQTNVSVTSEISIADSLILKSGAFNTNGNLVMEAGSNIYIDGGSMSGTVQGNESYDVTYIGSSKNTSGELSGAGVRDVSMQLNNGQTLTLTTDMHLSRNLALTSGTLNTNGFDIYVGGNFINNAAFMAGTGTVNFTGTSAQQISGTSTTTFNNLALNNSSGLTLNAPAIIDSALILSNGTFEAGTNLTLAAGAVIEICNGILSGTLQGTNAYNVTYKCGSKSTGTEVSGINLQDLTVALDNGAELTLAHNLKLGRNLLLNSGSFNSGNSSFNIQIKGNFGNYSGNFSAGNCRVIFNGSSTQTIAGAATIFHKLIINSSAGLSLSADVIVEDSLELSSGTFIIGSQSLTLNGGITGTTANLQAGSTSSIIFGGSNNNIVLPGHISTLRKMVIANPSGISLAGNLAIADSLGLTGGSLTLGAYNLSIFQGGLIWGNDSTRYIITKDDTANAGFLKRGVSNNNKPVLFPIGTSTTYSPVKITLGTGATTDNFSVRVFDKMLQKGTTGTQLTQNVVNKTWLIEEETTGGADATIELGWLTSAHATAFDLNNCGVAHYTNNQWSIADTFLSASLVNGIYWQSRSGITGFSPFAITDNELEVEAPLTLTAILHGAYDSNAGQMRTDLNSQQLLPTAQPYNYTPFSYSGTESVNSIPNTNIVDWVLVELRNAPSAGTATATAKINTAPGFILKDGSVVSTDGVTPIRLKIKPSGNYFIVLYHRCHLPVMSATAIKINNFSFDFTTDSTKAYGGVDAQMKSANGKFGLICGRADNTVDPFTISTADKAKVWQYRNTFGYDDADCNLDGVVDATDRTVIFNNINKTSQIP